MLTPSISRAAAAAVLALPTLLTFIGCSIADRGRNDASTQCIELCKKKLDEGADLSKGPCLSDDLPGGVIVRDTVCDVAHNPRTEEDDEPDNQCETYRSGRAGHFVEVTPHCEFIRER